MSEKSNIVFYTAPTPNGHKISIILEELGIEYETTLVNLQNVEQMKPWFLAINPNGRVPALTEVLPDGTTINVFESGSIQEYLVYRYDVERKISYAPGTDKFYLTNNWVCGYSESHVLERDLY
jgi:glutathione S-transferase